MKAWFQGLGSREQLLVAAAAVILVLLLLFALPVGLLGAVSPFVLRLVLADVRNTGRTAGHLSAVVTLGSLLGALLPGLVLVIP